jgi:hypothetical protein
MMKASRHRLAFVIWFGNNLWLAGTLNSCLDTTARSPAAWDGFPTGDICANRKQT